ncbi:DUF899 family protein [Nonomuraea sp. NPDC004354]
MSRPALFESATPEYVKARAELLSAERRLRELGEQVAARRRALPPGPELDDDPPLAALDGSPARLSGLFGDHHTLLVYNMMFDEDWPEPCPLCSMWVDGIDAVTPHLLERTAVAVMAPAGPARLAEVARRRQWRWVPLYSTRPGDLTDRLGLRAHPGDLEPVVTVYDRSDGRVRISWQGSAMLSDPGDEPYQPGDGGDARGLDLLCATWSLLDLLPQGRGDWYPSRPAR